MFLDVSNEVQKTTTTFSGQVEETIEIVSRNDLNSTEQLELVMTLCEDPAVGGTLETVLTPMGAID